MYSKYREQDLKTPPDYRGFGLKRFHCSAAPLFI